MSVDFHGDHKTVTKLRLIWPPSVFGDITRFKIVFCELMYGRRIHLRMKGAANKRYVSPAILYGSEAWCLRESEMGILHQIERTMVRVMCGAQLKD